MSLGGCDQLENYFARQCSISGRKDNPVARYFGYNDNSIWNQKVFRPIGGNIRGVYMTSPII